MDLKLMPFKDDGVGTHPGECVSSCVGSSLDVADVCDKLGHKVEMSGLSG